MRALMIVYFVEAGISLVGAGIVSWSLWCEHRNRSWLAYLPFVVLASVLWFLVWPVMLYGWWRHTGRSQGEA